MARLFGTDGVRGIANQGLTPELAYALGRYGAAVLVGENYHSPGDSATRPLMLIGRDTRVSGAMLEAAITAGITSVGVDAHSLGVIPTPGVAHLVRAWGADAGVMISASHNPAPDNGIKFFSGDGYKLEDEVEDRIELAVRGTAGVDSSRGGAGFWFRATADGVRRPIGGDVGRIAARPEAIDAYGGYLQSTVTTRLTGLKLVVDSGNGAAYQLTPVVLRALGAEVISLYDRPDGLNINVGCGSTHPQALAEAVIRHGADAGVAHDGDADRLIAVDEQGSVLDGDDILTICGLHLLRQGRLPHNRIAITVYSNMGVQAALRKAGGDVVVTANGDRYVLAAMRAQGLALGGEQSGHIIFLQHNTTGDGALTALQLLGVMQREAKPLSVLAATLEKYPQALINVPVKDKEAWQKHGSVRAVIRRVTEAFGDEGRLYVRASGTENLVRIMAEGRDGTAVRQAAGEVADVIRDALGS